VKHGGPPHGTGTGEYYLMLHAGKKQYLYTVSCEYSSRTLCSMKATRRGRSSDRSDLSDTKPRSTEDNSWPVGPLSRTSELGSFRPNNNHARQSKCTSLNEYNF
jgi:hypothetical protein